MQLYMTGNITPASMHKATSLNGMARCFPCVKTAIRQSAVSRTNAAAGQMISGSSMLITQTKEQAIVST